MYSSFLKVIPSKKQLNLVRSLLMLTGLDMNQFHQHYGDREKTIAQD